MTDSDSDSDSAASAAVANAPAFVTVDLAALAANYAWLVAAARPARVAAVVKADAYGLGVAAVAARLVAEGCREFFVADLVEARELRALQPAPAIYSLGGLPEGAAEACLAARIVPVLNTLDEVRAWVAAAPGRPAALQLDTGMTRAGLGAAEVERLAADAALLAGLRLELVLTHLACADEPKHPLNARQVERFEALRRRLPPAPTSIGNSAGALSGPAFRGDLVRPGIALYGGNPFATGESPVQEVVRLQARVLQVREVDGRATVGYGATHVVRPPARIATVGAGYADGYPRILGGRAYAVASGRRVPVVGRVSMDLLTLDATTVPELRVGDVVALLGDGIRLDELAAAAGTIGYELLTRLSPRLPRRYL